MWKESVWEKLWTDKQKRNEWSETHVFCTNLKKDLLQLMKATIQMFYGFALSNNGFEKFIKFSNFEIIV